MQIMARGWIPAGVGVKREADHSLRVLVFTGGKLDMRESLVQLEVTVKVVRVETLFPPVDLDAGVFDRLDELDRVWLGRALARLSGRMRV